MAPERPPRPLEKAPGIFDPKHFASCLGGPSLLYDLLLYLTPIETAWVRGRRPTSSRWLASKTGIPRTTIRNWLSQLETDGYVSIRQTEAGQTIGIHRRKWWRGSRQMEADLGGRDLAQVGEIPPGMVGEIPPTSGEKWARNGPGGGRDSATQLHLTQESTNGSEPLSDRDLRLPENLSQRSGRQVTSPPRPRAGQTSNFESEKTRLLERYRSEDEGDQHELRAAFDRVKGSRKAQRVADSVLLSILLDLDRFEVRDVLSGTRAFLRKDSIHGNPERYWIGCVRGARKEREAKERLEA